MRNSQSKFFFLAHDSILYNNNIYRNLTDRVGYDGQIKIVRKNNKIYYTYLTKDFYNYLSVYDITTGKVESNTIIGNAVKDNHCGLTLFIDKSNYIHLMGGSHDEAKCYYYRSTIPLGTTFTEQLIEGMISYPMMYELGDNKMQVCYRKTNVGYSETLICYREKNISDLNWGNEVILAKGGAYADSKSYYPSYALTFYGNKDISILNCEWYLPAPVDKSPRHFVLYKNTSDGIWRKLNGTTAILPVASDYYNYSGTDIVHSCADIDGNSIWYTMSERDYSSIKLFTITNNALVQKNILSGEKVFVMSSTTVGKYKVIMGGVYNTRDIVIYVSEDDFTTYKKYIVEDRGSIPNWSSVLGYKANDNEIDYVVLTNKFGDNLSYISTMKLP